MKETATMQTFLNSASDANEGFKFLFLLGLLLNLFGSGEK